MSSKLIYTGKAKDIYTTEDENVIKSVYKDQANYAEWSSQRDHRGERCAE